MSFLTTTGSLRGEDGVSNNPFVLSQQGSTPKSTYAYACVLISSNHLCLHMYFINLE